MQGKLLSHCSAIPCLDDADFTGPIGAIGHRQQHPKMHLSQLSHPCHQAATRPSVSSRSTAALEFRRVCTCLRQIQLPARRVQLGHLQCLAPAAAVNSTLQLDAQQTTAAAAGISRTENDPSSALEDFMVWLVNNGVEGIGTEESALALYEDAEGDRGVLADQDIPAGAVLVRVPLRLAITDVMEEEEQQRVVGQGAMWQDRLVAKLLQERQKGQASGWYPYLQALPRSVPSAVDTFTPYEAEQVQLRAAVASIKEHEAKMQSSWSSCRPDAIGGADLAAYRWAHTIVMSRTFGNASPEGGVGVRMCMPLIDMLNHAGDEAVDGLLSTCDVVSRDNVRWDVVAPDNSASGLWEMVLSSTKPISNGEPLLLSYREGLNEDFMLCYGFVPPSNSHDTVQLFSGLNEALEHLWQQDLAQGKSPDELREVYMAAHDAGLQVLQEEVAAAAAGVNNSWGQLLETLEPIQVATGSRVSGSFIVALEVLHQGDMTAAGAAVASLAWQQLQALPTSLLWDLAWLVQDGVQQQDAAQVQLFGGLLRHYVQAMAPTYEPDLWQDLAAAAAAGAASVPSSSSTSGSSSGAVNGSKPGRNRIVPGPPKPPQQEQQALGTQQQQRPSQAQSIASLPLQMLASAVLSQQQQQHQQQQQQEQQHHQQQSPGLAASNCRPAQLRLAVKFRVNKKMLLADVLLAAPVPKAQLEQQWQQLLAYRAASAAARLSPNRVDASADGSDPGLPWQC